MPYQHEPRPFEGKLWCLADGQPWPCEVERLRRTRPRHSKPEDAGCPACAKNRRLLDLNRAEAVAVADAEGIDLGEEPATVEAAPSSGLSFEEELGLTQRRR